MKTIHFSILSALVIILVLTATLANRSMAFKSATSKTINGDGFVVLELFTSEGCSSCPAADELLAQVQRQAGDKPVYVLAYHVDYWDRLGWKDVFSSPDYSKRQYQYAGKLGAQVYTPQVVVNGKTEFVGSNRQALDYMLASGLSGKPASTLELSGTLQNGKLELRYQLSGKTQGNELLVALVQKSAVHQIKRGENEGRTLTHAQIVRSLQTFPLHQSTTGKIRVNLPKEYNTSGWEIIGLVQNSKSMTIQAASRANLSSAKSNTLSSVNL